MITVSKQKTYIHLVMEKIYKRRPIEELLKVDEVEDWEFPNEEMELFPYQFGDKRYTNNISNLSEVNIKNPEL